MLLLFRLKSQRSHRVTGFARGRSRESHAECVRFARPFAGAGRFGGAAVSKSDGPESPDQEHGRPGACRTSRSHARPIDLEPADGNQGGIDRGTGTAIVGGKRKGSYWPIVRVPSARKAQGKLRMPPLPVFGCVNAPVKLANDRWLGQHRKCSRNSRQPAERVLQFFVTDAPLLAV